MRTPRLDERDRYGNEQIYQLPTMISELQL
jgi:hypothetical protein